MSKILVVLGFLLALVLFVFGACAPAILPAPVSPSAPASEITPVPSSSPPLAPPESGSMLLPTPAPAAGDFIRLYYYGPSALGVDPAFLPGLHCIYSATSSDGIVFREDPGVRFSYDTELDFGIVDPDVVQLNDGSWLMFVGSPPQIGTDLVKAVASDSTGAFVRDEAFIWKYGGVPGSYNFDGTVRIFTCFHGGIHVGTYDQSSGTLNYDGVALNPPASGLVADPSVIQAGGEYLMFYKYAASSSMPPQEHEIYLSTSADGITWSQHDRNRFISRGSVPGAVYYGGIIYVYYCGQSGKPGVPQGDLGVAISQDKGATFIFSTITVQGKVAAGVVDPAAMVVSGDCDCDS